MRSVNEYREAVHNDIKLAAHANESIEADEFLMYAVGILSNAEEFDDFVYCHYEGVSRRRNICIDGYAKDDTDGSLCVIISDYHGSDGSESIIGEDIKSFFKKIRYFVEESINTELYCDIYDNQAAIDFSRDLYYDSDLITKYRFYLLTDAYNKQNVKTIKTQKIGDKTVELNVWDISRIYDLVCSKAQKESIEIDLEDMGYEGIPCVKAVDYHNVIADIEVPPTSDFEDDSDSRSNIVTYESYLAVIPGEVLNDIYLEYGAKLLEGNVRSFLSVRGKVNKSIQSTIKNYPEMFFAYNNGIAATATKVETEMTESGLKILKIKDLQIVNGGQTTASIVNTVLTAKKNENVDLSKLYVPMKLSVLEQSMAEKIIPKISEYSNSQNKVDASDFFSNHPFHVRMEEYSMKVAIPSLNGNQFQQYWFYERTRGQYNQGKLKYGSKVSLLKKYKNRYPEKMVITKLDLARYMMLYDCQPYVVSKGKQKTLQVFAEKVKKQWNQSDSVYNLFYYKRMVAIGIMYKAADEIIKKSTWYGRTKSYKANVIAYTLSIIFYYVQKKYKNQEIDFMRIWDAQDIYYELEEQIEVLSHEVYNFITGPRDTENVTEWCKKELCWVRAKDQIWTINDSFIYSLIDKAELVETEKEEKKVRKIANEVDVIKFILDKGSDYWRDMLKWGIERGLLTEKEISGIRMAANIHITGRIPPDWQAKLVYQARQRLIEEGMPLQF